MAEFEFTPLPQPSGIDPLAADHHQPDAGRQRGVLLGQVENQLVPERRRQVEHGDLLLRQRAEEARHRSRVGAVVEDQGRARGERGQDLLQAGVPAERGELEHAVLGGEAEQPTQGTHRDRQRLPRDHHRLGRSGGTRRAQHIGRMVTSGQRRVDVGSRRLTVESLVRPSRHRMDTVQAEHRGEGLPPGDRQRGVDRAVDGTGPQYPQEMLGNGGSV